jgi:histidinol-phosphate aminotransferase
MGVGYVPSHGNFLLVHVGAAGAAYEKLLRQGVIVRSVASYGLPEHLRVTVGLPDENRRFLAALRSALGR